MGGWVVVIPVKRISVAKSRLAGFAGPLRGELALAFAADTLAAATASEQVRAVAGVTDDPAAIELARTTGCLHVPDGPDAGLNEALVHGASVAAEHWPDLALAALSSDLPALSTDDLTAALLQAERLATGSATRSGAGRCFVPDADGRGTTLLTATSLGGFVPRFGPASAAAHRAGGAQELAASAGSAGAAGESAWASLRRDVDTPADLEAAEALGLGSRTRAVLAVLRTRT